MAETIRIVSQNRTKGTAQIIVTRIEDGKRVASYTRHVKTGLGRYWTGYDEKGARALITYGAQGNAGKVGTHPPVVGNVRSYEWDK